MNLRLLFFFILIFSVKSSLAQYPPEISKKVDSIQLLIDQNPDDTLLLDYLLALDDLIYRFNPSLDEELNKKMIHVSDRLLNKENLTNRENILHNKARSLNILGIKAKKRGAYDEAYNYYMESLNIRNKLGEQGEVAGSYNNLGSLAFDEGRYEQALELYEKANTIYIERNDTKGRAKALMNQANIFGQRGNIVEALDYYGQARELLKEIDAPDIEGPLLANLAIYHQKLNNLKKAKSLFSEALGYYETDNNLSGIINGKMNYAACLTELGEMDQAREILLELREVAQKYNIIPLQVSVGINLGNIESSGNNLDRAIQLYSKSLALAESINLAERSEIYINLARVYVSLNKLDSAEFLAFKGLELARDYNQKIEERKAEAYIRDLLDYRGNDKDAIQFATEVAYKQENFYKQNLPILSEAEQTLLVESQMRDFERLYATILSSSSGEDTLTDIAFDFNLSLKGTLLKSSTRMRQLVLNSENKQLIQQYEDWIALKRRIVRDFTKGNSVDSLEEKANNLEKGLFQKSQQLSAYLPSTQYRWQEVKQGLKESEIAIEFIRFHFNDSFDFYDAGNYLYAALIIDNESAHPKMIRLFEEPELEKILGTFPGNNLSYIEQVYGNNKNIKTQLYDLIWKPMEEALEGTKKVFVSPVGLLHKISFAALAKEQDVYLCDVYDIEMKSSTGKLALNGEDDVAETFKEKRKTTLFGGIQYNSDSTNSNMGWNYLDGSLDETKAIEKILKKQKQPYQHFTLANATEAQFKQTASESDILHIATHGFFYPDPDEVMEESVDETESNEDLVFRGGRTGMGSNTFVKSRNPLMRSGLAFAGANDVWNRSNIEGEDGVLTAAEVATIDMRNTDLVVLSACETGLGDIKGSEGVYGLQRSFKMAGVKYLIMSLWQVPDKETAEFMTTFYKYLTENNDIKKSFNQTQKEMRKKYDPYYWAAFVLVE